MKWIDVKTFFLNSKKFGMEFTVVTRQSFIKETFDIQDLKIISMPDAFLVFMNCASRQEFQKGIAHMSFSYDYKNVLMLNKYCKVGGSFIFRHPVTLKTAIVGMDSQKVLLDQSDVVCINTIHNILWQDNDEVYEFLGILETKCRIGVVQAREIEREDRKYFAIPTMKMSDEVRSQLKFLKCHFNINVNYGKEYQKIQRSVLFPTSLLQFSPIPCSEIFSIISMGLNGLPKHAYASSNQVEIFNVPQYDGLRDFRELISTCHTSSEMQRIEREILPIIKEMQQGQEMKFEAEFVTPRGLEMYEIVSTMHSRNILLCEFKKHDEG